MTPPTPPVDEPLATMNICVECYVLGVESLHIDGGIGEAVFTFTVISLFPDSKTSHRILQPLQELLCRGDSLKESQI